MGGSAFVPPPPEIVGDYLIDLCAFCNDDSLPAIAQAAIAHAQFETIHPFIDGNGRTGRALIHLVLRRRGLTSRVLPPISLVLATWADDYIRALDGTRFRGDPTSQEAHEGINRLIGLVAAACGRAVADATAFEQRVATLQTAWRERLRGVRAGSATDLLIRQLPGAPILTVTTAAELIGRSGQAANVAIGRLVDARVLKQVGGGRRNRAFEAAEMIDAFTDLERQLASSVGGTPPSSAPRPFPAAPIDGPACHNGRMDEDLQRGFGALAAEYGLLAIYVFGSRAEEVAARVAGSPVAAAHPESDVDVGVEPLRGRRLTAQDRVRIVKKLETMLGADRVDLVILPETNAFLAADAVRGELLLATDLDAEAEVQLYYLRRAADLAPLLREQWREMVGSGS